MNKNLPLALVATLALHNLAHAADINIVEQAAEGGAAIVVTLGLSILFLAVSRSSG